MRIYIETIEHKNIVLISADEILDLSAYNTFKEAASISRNNPDAMVLEVDFYHTKKVFDSGIAMLQDLKKMSGTSNNSIYLTNVSADIEHTLIQAGLHKQFRINSESADIAGFSNQPTFRKAG